MKKRNFASLISSIAVVCYLVLFADGLFAQEMYPEDSIEFELSSLRLEIEDLNSQIETLKTNLSVQKERNKELHLINDTLVVVNNEIKQQLSEKNALLEEKIRILQQKEILFAEKEQVYKEAISTSNIDKAKIEGLVEAKNASIEGKDKEISLLQKSINEKETHISTKDAQLRQISEERDRYFNMSDTLREQLKAAQIVIMQREEELKYTRKRAEEAEEKVLTATNRKKKVRVIQGLAMHFAPMPDWVIRPRFNSNKEYVNIIENANAGAVDFDLVVGASVMLFDLTKPNQRFTQDLGIYDALNKGVLIAKGEWIYVLGADDELLPDGLRSFFLGENDFEYDIIYGNTIDRYFDGILRYTKSKCCSRVRYEMLGCHQGMIMNQRKVSFQRIL